MDIKYKALVIILVGLLTACGFQPLHTQKSTSSGTPILGSNIQIAPIANREGQILRGYLQERLNPHGQSAPEYILETNITESRQDLGIERDTTATFARLSVTANYVLKSTDTGVVLLRSSARSINSFNVVDSPYAEQIAEQDARERALREIADDMALRLNVFFKNQ